jgi:hypothetical protein
MFQGLALPNSNIDLVSQKLHLVQNEWGTDGVMGKRMNQDYQVFQVEAGLHCSIFDYSFEDCGDLATHGFIWKMWQLLRLFGVQFRIHVTFDIPLFWQDDRTVESVAGTAILSRGDLVRMNRVRHHKKVQSIGDLTQFDRIRVDLVMFLREEGESYRGFHTQWPTAPNHGLWLHAIEALTVCGHKLHHPLGIYIKDPHQPDIWFICKNSSEIYRQLSAQEYEVYQRKMMGRQTRYRTRYLLKDTQEGECSRLVRVIGRD